MNKIIVCIVLLFAVLNTVSALEIKQTLEDVVPDCDIVVIGKLGATTRSVEGDYVYYRAWITVDKVIFGAIASGDSLLLKWHANFRVVCPRTDHSGRVGISKIWLLTAGDNGAYRAPSNQLVRDLSERVEIERILRTYPVRVKSKWHYTPDEPVSVTLIFRNATLQAISIPKYETRNDVLYLHPAVGISTGNVRAMFGNEKERVRFWPESETVLVPSGAEYSVTVDVSRILPISRPPNRYDQHEYSFQFWIDDYPIIRRTWFRYGYEQ